MGGSVDNLFQNKIDKFFKEGSHDVTAYDIVFISVQECIQRLRTQRTNALETYLAQKGFANIDQQNGLVFMYQMFMIGFVKKPLMADVTKVTASYLAKGKNLLVASVGNKGGLGYSFNFRNRIFNFIGCHLQHKMDKQAKRNQMSRDLIAEIKMQQVQTKVNGLESDVVGDFCFYFGDMNYRLKTTFQALDNSNVQQQAVGMIETHDQLIEAQQTGHYPGYQEHPIDFLPSYKLSNYERQVYVNKKDQAPSYCDRVLYKNNMAIKAKPLSYESLDECYGSDHRPVVLQLALRHFERVRYWEFAPLTRFSGTSEVSSEVGVIDFDYL